MMNIVEKVIGLIEFTKIYSKNNKRLKENCRLKEISIDYFLGDTQFKLSDKLLENYLNPFLNYANYTGKIREKRRMGCQR